MMYQIYLTYIMHYSFHLKQSFMRYNKYIKMKHLTIIAVLILTFYNGFSQTNKLTPAQEDSVVRFIDQTILKLHKPPPDYVCNDCLVYKHHKTMLLGDQLIFCSTTENKKKEIEFYKIDMINLKYAYLDYFISVVVTGNDKCTIRSKLFFPKKKKSTYDVDVFSDTTQFIEHKLMCEDRFSYGPILAWNNKNYNESTYKEFVNALEALAFSHGGGQRRIFKLDRVISFLGCKFNEDRSYFDEILLKGTAKKTDKLTFENVDTSFNPGFREFFGARVKNIHLGFNEQRKLKCIKIDFYNSGFQLSSVVKKIEEPFGRSTAGGGRPKEWYIHQWKGQYRTLELLDACFQRTPPLDEKTECYKITIIDDRY